MALTSDLLPLLEKQIEIQNRLIEIENQKTGVITSGDVKKLDNLLNLEQPFVMHNSVLGRQRESLLAELGYEGAGLKQLVSECGDADAESLKTGLKELEGTAERLRRLVRMNMGILRARLRVINHVLDICGVQNQSATYTNDGYLQVPSENL